MPFSVSEVYEVYRTMSFEQALSSLPVESVESQSRPIERYDIVN